MPWDNNSAGASTSSYSFAASKGAAPKSPIQPNDKVVIFGATGGIGQLVTKKLSNARSDKNYKLTVVAREASRARELLEDDESGGELNVAELNLVGEDKASDEELMEAMSGEFIVGFFALGEYYLLCSILRCHVAISLIL